MIYSIASMLFTSAVALDFSYVASGVFPTPFQTHFRWIGRWQMFDVRIISMLSVEAGSWYSHDRLEHIRTFRPKIPSKNAFPSTKLSVYCQMYESVSMSECVYICVCCGFVRLLKRHSFIHITFHELKHDRYRCLLCLEYIHYILAFRWAHSNICSYNKIIR